MALASGCTFVVEKDWSQLQSLAGPRSPLSPITLLPKNPSPSPPKNRDLEGGKAEPVHLGLS